MAAALVILSMGVLTYKGAVAKEPIASEVEGGDPELGAEAGLRRTTRRRSRARTCSPSRAARTATPTSAPAARTSARRTSRAEGAKSKGIQFQIDHLKCPSCVNPGSPMPPFAALGEDNLHKLAAFLEASKGPK